MGRTLPSAPLLVVEPAEQKHAEDQAKHQQDIQSLQGNEQNDAQAGNQQFAVTTVS